MKRLIPVEIAIASVNKLVGFKQDEADLLESFIEFTAADRWQPIAELKEGIGQILLGYDDVVIHARWQKHHYLDSGDWMYYLSSGIGPLRVKEIVKQFNCFSIINTVLECSRCTRTK